MLKIRQADGGQDMIKLPKELRNDIDKFLLEEYDELNHEITVKSIVMHDFIKDELELEESFVDKLLQFINKTGETDSVIYKRAYLDRRHFSKIRSNKHYIPKKKTVLALAIGLILTEEETEVLLKSAGYSLSKSIKTDQIIRFCIKKEIYNINLINNILFEYGEDLLGRH